MPAAAKQPSERAFWSTLFLVFGPLFGLGGWMAAFTTAGAEMILVGTAMSVAGFALRPTWWRLSWLVVGLGVTWGLPFAWALF